VDDVNSSPIRNVATVNIVAHFRFRASISPFFHHGNLRQVLLDAGVALIRKVGPKSFTMREVARRAGVSHNAPYRHFRDKDELISAIVGQGFERLNDAMIG
jgi:AcrR family transcriptional regulator